MSRDLSFALLLVGGILSLLEATLAGLMTLIFVNFPVLSNFTVLLGGVFTLWGIIVGILLIVAALKINTVKKNVHNWAVVGTVFSLLGLLTLQGFIIGPILALIGAVLALEKK